MIEKRLLRPGSVLILSILRRRGTTYKVEFTQDNLRYLGELEILSSILSVTKAHKDCLGSVISFQRVWYILASSAAGTRTHMHIELTLAAQARDQSHQKCGLTEER